MLACLGSAGKGLQPAVARHTSRCLGPFGLRRVLNHNKQLPNSLAVAAGGQEAALRQAALGAARLRGLKGPSALIELASAGANR